MAFHLAARNPEFVRGLAFMEFTWPMPTWNDFHADAMETFQKFRTPGVGEEMIVGGNVFVESVLPAATVRKLTDEEMAVYRAPFPTPRSRIPTWRFPNELPIAGEPADVYATLEKAHEALALSSYPKLLFAGNPGALVSPAFAASFAKSLKNCDLIQLDTGIHYLQEDNAEVIGTTISKWLADMALVPGRWLHRPKRAPQGGDTRDLVCARANQTTMLNAQRLAVNWTADDASRR